MARAFPVALPRAASPSSCIAPPASRAAAPPALILPVSAALSSSSHKMCVSTGTAAATCADALPSQPRAGAPTCREPRRLTRRDSLHCRAQSGLSLPARCVPLRPMSPLFPSPGSNPCRSSPRRQ
ncbi:uncharacterized protein SCHCODRAFT_02594624 [Schizophyllum commune H4-8]|uniref:Expressed protein n=1 Tax=Schizophyllum commune (strain H4-8 / FGSC 9210) TaxID=578458 RepID=D8QL94_SCHCM|nr:uncharacterized protein SCHCODRAFT_02594624 [Schizophyllum commune H4-8]KAI5884803.1 hypothetical protein SCHCODRAFT_02594624 [Schizophyllum commune H4-8]